MPAGSLSTGRAILMRVATASAVGAASVGGAIALAGPAHAVSSDASAYLSRLNAERVDHGLRALTMRTDLNGVAQQWSNHMAAAGLLSHNPNLTSQISNWQTVGENVGEGPDLAALDAAFWNSPGHRANILDSSYRDIGIGTAYADGVLWITIDFRKPMTSESAGTVATARTSTVHRTLRVGSRGHDVARVQRRVHVRADGVFGRRTKRAVVHFQRRHHLHANGVIGPRTWRKLHP
jgi:peptidoglycan hydrolase-like protein with peptidoglycan-binding domain